MSFSDEAAIYDKTTQYLLLDYNQTLSQVVKHIGLRKNSSIKILDVGCGTGNLAKQIRQEYPRAQIYALDFSEDMIKVAIEKNIPQVHFITADLYDVEELDLPYFDIIIATFVFHNFRDVREHSRAMTALNKLLSVNGKLIIADLIDPEDTEKKDRNREKLMLLMREHHLMEEEIYSWIGKLNIEDKPLTIQKTINCLHEAGFIGVQTFISNESYSAIFVGKKDADIIQIKP